MRKYYVIMTRVLSSHAYFLEGEFYSYTEAVKAAEEEVEYRVGKYDYMVFTDLYTAKQYLLHIQTIQENAIESYIKAAIHIDDETKERSLEELRKGVA